MSTLSQLLGIKVGMTQVFDAARKVVPVTVIECGQWIVTQVKTEECDGYNTLQVGLLRKRYRGRQFDMAWLKKMNTYFAHVKEIAHDGGEYVVGQLLTVNDSLLEEQNVVDVTGFSKGRGFQGVVKRWGFGGGPSSHGSMFHRLPGSIGNMASQGNVLKGKKLPGQYGNKKITVKGLKVVKVDAEKGIVLVKGAVPGKKNSLLRLSKQG